MKFDASRLPQKLWIAPSEISACEGAVDDQFVNQVETGLATGSVIMRGRRANAVEVQDPIGSPEVQAEQDQPGALVDTVSLFHSGVTWVDEAYKRHFADAQTKAVVMKAQGEPEDIDSYYFSEGFHLNWEKNQVRFGGDVEWHDVRFDQESLLAMIEQKTGILAEPEKRTLLAEATKEFEKRVSSWPSDQPYPSERDDWRFMQEKFPNLRRADLRDIRQEITPEEWTKRGRKTRRSKNRSN